ncbi:MAG: DUF86 domain-containing protein [Candidatus Bipolaricaulaceae bacterium]
MSRTYRDYLEDMLNAAREVCEFTKNMDFDTFQRDRRTVNAVIRSLEAMGEAAKRIPEDWRRRYSEIPWKPMAAMRDKLIHEYHGVDLAMVWKTATEDIPPLVPLLERVLQDWPEHL